MGWVFNCKLGSFTDETKNAASCKWQLLMLKTRPRFRPVSWSFSMLYLNLGHSGHPCYPALQKCNIAVVLNVIIMIYIWYFRIVRPVEFYSNCCWTQWAEKRRKGKAMLFQLLWHFKHFLCIKVFFTLLITKLVIMFVLEGGIVFTKHLNITLNLGVP